jgi:nitrile hydratase accessory protein
MSIFGTITLTQHDVIRPNPAALKDGQLAEPPVFAAPWEAQAFAMAVELNQRGLFQWQEFADLLSEELLAAGATQDGEDYYRHWLRALERLTAAKGFITEPERAERQAAWDAAAKATPHGEPIELEKAARGGR